MSPISFQRMNSQILHVCTQIQPPFEFTRSSTCLSLDEWNALTALASRECRAQPQEIVRRSSRSAAETKNARLDLPLRYLQLQPLQEWGRPPITSDPGAILLVCILEDRGPCSERQSEFFMLRKLSGDGGGCLVGRPCREVLHGVLRHSWPLYMGARYRGSDGVGA